MSKKIYSACDLIVGDIIKLLDSDIIYRVNEISYFSIWLENTNKNDNRIARPITNVDYYRTEPIKSWQDILDEIGFEYLTTIDK